MGKQKKRRHPRVLVLVRIAIIFFLARLLSITIALLAGENYMMEQAALTDLEVARAAYNTALRVVKPYEDFNNLTEDEAAHIRKAFLRYCENFNFKYFYLVDVDPDKKIKYYYVCAASDVNDDKILQNTRPYGSMRQGPIIDCEANVKKGKKAEDHAFVDNKYGSVCTYSFPVYAADGKTVRAIIGIDADISTTNKLMKNQLRTVLVMVGVSFFLAIILSLVLTEYTVIIPLNNLSMRMSNFLKDKDNTARKDHFFSDEITDIEQSFDEMAADIRAYVSDLEKLSLEKAQTKAELDVAKRIQCGIMPLQKSLQGGGFQITGYEKPAKEVGGDFYDIFRIDEKRICFIVGDISGKGVSAAMFMVMVKTALKESLKNSDSIAKTLNTVNNEVCMSNTENMFATVFAAILDTETGILKYANAGHDRPLILTKEPYYLNPQSGMALGLFEDPGICDEEISLKNGEGILIYTDGVTESIDDKMNQYGTERLKEVAARSYLDNENKYDAEALALAVGASVKEHAAGREQFDDITCVVAIHTGSSDEAMVLSPDLESFKRVKQSMLSALGDRENIKDMILACEEIFANIVNYSGAKNVSFISNRTEKSYRVEFIDDGIPFDPCTASVKEKDFLDLDTGGMGIKLARLYTQEMHYIRSDDRNHLTLVFEI